MRAEAVGKDWVVLPEEHKPAVDEGCDWPPAYSPVTFGGMEA